MKQQRHSKWNRPPSGGSLFMRCSLLRVYLLCIESLDSKPATG